MNVIKTMTLSLIFIFTYYIPLFSIEVTIPDTTGEAGLTILIPIEVGDLTGSAVISYQTEVSFDESVLDAIGATSMGTLSGSFGAPTVNTQQNGLIAIAGFGTDVLSGSGTLVFLQFRVVGLPLESTDLNFSSFAFNSGNPAAEVTRGKLTVIQTPVPVELSLFSAQLVGSSVRLKWKTETEFTNFGFEIQKSMDGNTFRKIGFIPGKGTTSEPQSYEFQDQNFQSGIVYYRLKQIDYDGTFKHSEKIKVEINVPNDVVLSQNYPNPFNPETLIEFRIAYPAKVLLTIFSMNGVEIKLLIDDTLDASQHRIKWNGLDNQNVQVASGVYIYELKVGTFKVSRKMLLLH